MPLTIDPALLRRDLATRPLPEVQAILTDAREVVYSGATRIRALSSEADYSREDAQAIMAACLDLVSPPEPPPDSDPCAPVPSGRAPIGHGVDFSGTFLTAP